MPSSLTDESRPSSLNWHHSLLTDGDLPLLRFGSYDRIGRPPARRGSTPRLPRPQECRLPPAAPRTPAPLPGRAGASRHLAGAAGRRRGSLGLCAGRTRIQPLPRLQHPRPRRCPRLLRQLRSRLHRRFLEPTVPPQLAPARGPPLWEAGAQCDADPLTQPSPEFEFDQRIA